VERVIPLHQIGKPPTLALTQIKPTEETERIEERMVMFRLPLAAALLGSLLIVGTPAYAAGSMKIGAVLSLSGALADFGLATHNAVDLALAQINAAGGVLGAPLAIDVADDRSDQQGALEAAHKLANSDKVNAFIGPMGSSAYLAVATNVAIPLNLPIVTGSATAATIDGLDAKGLVFRTVPSDSQQGAALAEVARDKSYRNVSILFQNTDYGKGLADSFGKAFTKLGGKVAASIPFDPKQAGSHGEVKAAATGRAEALLVIAYPTDGAILLKQALDNGLFNKFLLSDGLKDPAVVEAVGGQFLDGVTGASASPPADSEGFAVFEKAYSAKFGDLPPTPYLDRTYDAVYLLALAAEKAKTTDGGKIKDALRDISGSGGEVIGPGEFAKAKQLIAQGKKISYQGAAGPYSFDSHGGITGSFARWQIQDGKFETTQVFTPKP
jgi:ABC-type branched-subunit amino acid transport system substrate-binding protein